MQKWEYLYVVAIGGTVVQINKETFRIPDQFDEDIEGTSIFDFLNEFGQKGWEAIGLATSPLVEGERSIINIILKRPLE